MCNLLGDWSYFYGPKLLVDLITLILAIYVLLVFLLFYFSSKNPKKMLFWLEHMQFDNENRCFNKLKLNQSDLKTFKRRMSLLRITYNIFVYSFFVIFVIFVIFANFSTFKYKYAYYFYYFIWITMNCHQFHVN